MSISANPAVPQGRRLRLGPIPPRDASGKMKLKPLMQPVEVRDPRGELILDENRNAMYHDADTRDKSDYMVFQQGPDYADDLLPGATAGLELYEVDDGNHAVLIVWAKDFKDAAKVFRKELGVIKFAPAPGQAFPTANITCIESGESQSVSLIFGDERVAPMPPNVIPA